MSLLRDFFFYLDRENKTSIQEGQLNGFLKEASEKGVKINETELAE